MSKNIFSLVAFIPFMLISGCSHNQLSAQRHAYHFVTATASDSSSPNFNVNISDSSRMATPFFEQFWEMGKKDREAGLPETDVKNRLKYFQSLEFTDKLRGKSHFAGSDYNPESSVSNLWRKEMSDAVSATYMDGYNGIK